MVIGKLKEIIMNDRVFTVCLTLAIMTLISSVTFYQYQQLKSIQSNVESAIVKGIDPIAVRCAYANERDVVCVAYGASHQSTPKSGK
jgi:hypothetical protein